MRTIGVPMGHSGDGTSLGEWELDEALEESFPASDPLATWSGADRAPHARATDDGQGPDPTRS